MRGPERFYLACAFRARASASTSNNAAAKLDAIVTMGRQAMSRAHDADGVEDAVLFDEDKTLLLDALERQASRGPCQGTRPWDLWDPAGALAYDAWSMLGNISPERAMELYCEVISSRYADWFDMLVRGMSEKQKRAMIATAKECALEYYRALASGALGESARLAQTKDARRALAFNSSTGPTAFLDEMFASAADDEFVRLPILSKVSPRARSGHMSAVVDGDTIFFSHGRGSRSRLLGDLWAFDLATGAWAERKLQWPGSTCAGAASATIGSKLYAFRGKSADDCDVDGVYSLTVSAIDLTADYASKDFKWTHVRCETSDEVSTPPRARSGHTSTAIGDRIFIFGGVDAKTGDDLDELWEFTPTTTVWKKLANGTRPRSSHAATSVAERYLLVCGGSTGNELCDCGAVDVYDVVKGEWGTVDGDNEDGDRPSPRAAHASVAIGNQWFVIGGGDNENAIQDAYTFDLRACADERKCRWTLFAESCALIGKEGMSASAVVSPSSKRVFLLLHGGLNEKGAVCDTIACRLAPLASH